MAETETNPASSDHDSCVESPERLPSERHRAQLQKLRSIFTEMGSALICFSGGIDSALLLRIATEQLDSRAIGMTAVSPSLPAREREACARIATELGADHRMIDSAEMSRPGYVANGPDRCFHCKTELYEIAERKRLEWNLAHVVNGTNLDDLGDYRPGLRAADAAQVRSPFLEADMNKQDVRAVAKLVGLSVWNKPASACLSSRIPYGVSVTRERLTQVEKLEAFLQELGFAQVRVRYHHELARIEVPLPDLPRLLEPAIRDRTVAFGKECGFSSVTMDLAGYRTGSLNEALPSRHLKVLS